MVKNYAILDKNNKALNFIVLDENAEYDYGKDLGNKLLEMSENVGDYAIGWVWDGNKFINPNPIPL